MYTAQELASSHFEFIASTFSLYYNIIQAMIYSRFRRYKRTNVIGIQSLLTRFLKLQQVSL